MSDKKEFDRDSISNTLIVAVGLSLVCSIIVSSAELMAWIMFIWLMICPPANSPPVDAGA